MVPFDVETEDVEVDLDSPFKDYWNSWFARC